MIAVTYGTTGELIKLLPVLDRLKRRGICYLSVTTAQQVEQIPNLLDSFSLPQPDIWLARGAHGRDLRTNREVPGWFFSVAGNFTRSARGLRRRLKAGPGKPLVLVHGDTMTTVIGSTMGRLMGVPVAHIEAGMRSHDLRQPFPEELNRRVTSKLANIHYAPGAYAAANLQGGVIIDTGSNTIRDSLDMIRPSEPLPFEVPDGPFGLVSLHRFELLNNRPVLTATMQALADNADRHTMLFIDHPVTAAALSAAGLDGLFGGGLRRIPRLIFSQFIELERRSAFVVTDSGGSQEETYYMDIPCLIHRGKTEHPEGVGENVVVSSYDIAVLHDFLREPGRFRRKHDLPPHSPSDTIVEDLVARGFAA
jgi:UDP-N-acetylglucosamine 2-epimerase (non-hydrolysing)